jgi:hypothetical protein
MRITATFLLASVLALAFAGCSGDPVPTNVTGSSQLHGGVLAQLPDNLGYVELLNGNRAKAKGKGGAADTTIVAYVLQPDKNTAIATLPTEVSVKMTTVKGPITVALRPEPDPADPVGAARFVSAMGPYDIHELSAEVVLNLGGKTVSASFRGPR